MAKLLILTVLFSIGNFLTPCDSTLAQEWIFVKEDNGIKLYNRSIEGYEYKEVMAILSLDVDLEKAQNYLMDPINIEKWMSGCSMSVEKKTSHSHKEYYAIFDAPWPVSDRDDYGRMEVTESSKEKLHITFRSIPDGTPAVSSMVRVPFSKGHVIIDVASDGSKTLTYQFLVDRGGSLPTYLREYLENSSPIKTVRSLQRSLEKL